MSRRCTVCVHPSRTRVEREIIAGEPIRRVATQYGLHEAALRRHRASHLRKALARALEKQDLGDIDADRIIEWANTLQGKTLVLLERAETLDDLSNASRLIAEARRNLELMARIVGVLEAPHVNIDARKQLAIIGKLDEGDLRALAGGDVIDAQAGEVLELVEAAAS